MTGDIAGYFEAFAGHKSLMKSGTKVKGREKPTDHCNRDFKKRKERRKE